MSGKMSPLYNKCTKEIQNTQFQREQFPPFFFWPLPPPPSSSLPPLLTFYCETGVDGLSSWNFYEYWSAGSSALWPAMEEEEWCTGEWKGKSGKRCSSGGGENQSGVLRGLGGCWGGRRDASWDALMGRRVMEKDLGDLMSHKHFITVRIRCLHAHIKTWAPHS